MSRSLKKAPYVCEKLLKRINELNESGEKKVLLTVGVVNHHAAITQFDEHL